MLDRDRDLTAEDLRLADPTHVVVTDGSPEAEAQVMSARIRAAAALSRMKEEQ